MAGTDKLTDAILKEASEKASAILSEAEGYAKEAVEKASAEAASLKEEADKKAATAKAAYLERMESQSSLQKRQIFLKKKQDLISEVTKAAYEKLSGADTASYFTMLEGLVKKYAHTGESGEIALSSKDLARIPDSFKASLESLSLSLSDKAASIDSGFILKYGGIEENCSLKALFEEKQDALQDAIAKELFG